MRQRKLMHVDDVDQTAFLARARARLRELDLLLAEAADALTSDDLAMVQHEAILQRDDIHGAVTRVLRGYAATLNAHPTLRYTIYSLDMPAARWLRVLTSRDLTTAVRHLIELQGFGEPAHLVAWLTLADRAAQERDPARFSPQCVVADAKDHVIRM
jgi:hypothetical protein